ncbi:hypothetical protein M885DRAFT_502305 [Pelagophyceae sp. CCMP2097]|nr:hypothetical protein M885DRAFT_502305 [Pelagophyceae sp. CCMP2097]
MLRALSLWCLGAASALEQAGAVRALRTSRRGALAGAATAAVVAAAPARARAAAALGAERAGFKAGISKGSTPGYSTYRDTVLGTRGSKTVVNVEFEFPADWTPLRDKLDLIDGSSGTVANVLAVPLVGAQLAALSKQFIANAIFSPEGKIQKGGTPVDEFKVLALRDAGRPGYVELDLRYTAVSPNMRLIDRRALATATQVGDSLYILFVSANAVKWDQQKKNVEQTARSFVAS